MARSNYIWKVELEDGISLYFASNSLSRILCNSINFDWDEVVGVERLELVFDFDVDSEEYPGLIDLRI